MDWDLNIGCAFGLCEVVPTENDCNFVFPAAAQAAKLAAMLIRKPTPLTPWQSAAVGGRGRRSKQLKRMTCLGWFYHPVGGRGVYGSRGAGVYHPLFLGGGGAACDLFVVVLSPQTGGFMPHVHRNHKPVCQGMLQVNIGTKRAILGTQNFGSLTPPPLLGRAGH